MNTIPELIAFLRTRPDLAEMLQKVLDFQLAKSYVDGQTPNAHVVKTVQRTVSGKRTVVAIYAVEISLNARQLIATGKASAPQLIGRVFAYPEPNHPFCVWAIDAYLSAAAHLKALEVVQGAA